MVLEWEEMVLSRSRSLIGRKGEGPIKGESENPIIKGPGSVWRG